VAPDDPAAEGPPGAPTIGAWTLRVVAGVGLADLGVPVGEPDVVTLAVDGPEPLHIATTSSTNAKTATSTMARRRQ
jgi:hypothetical protein